MVKVRGVRMMVACPKAGGSIISDKNMGAIAEAVLSLMDLLLVGNVPGAQDPRKMHGMSFRKPDKILINF
jgi:hypothetical protein